MTVNTKDARASGYSMDGHTVLHVERDPDFLLGRILMFPSGFSTGVVLNDELALLAGG